MVVIMMQGQADLTHVVFAVGRPGRLTGRLHCRQEKADERANDRNHNQEFHQRETPASG